MVLTLQQFCQRVRGCASSKREKELALLFSLRSQHSIELMNQLNGNTDFLDYCQRRMDPPFDSMAAHHLLTLFHQKCNDYVAAHKSQLNLLIELSTMMGSEDAWILPLMKTICYDTRVVSQWADRALGGAESQNSSLADAAQYFHRCFQSTVQDRSGAERNRKWGTLYVANTLLKVYFKLKNHDLCKPVVNAIENRVIKDLRQYPLSEAVTYNYFVGRLALFRGELESALEHLTFAYRYTPKRHVDSLRLALFYLIPVKMMLGQMPTQALTKQYKLTVYSKIAAAIISGNLRLFNHHLLMHQALFIQQGVYMFLERLRLLVYRCLFKKVYLVKASIKPEQAHLLTLDSLATALALVGETATLPAIECILCNLIHKGYIKGYIAHEKKILVLSRKSSPFPPVSEVKQL